MTKNSHNENLNNSKSEINYKDDVQINIKQSCDHEKLCQPESSNFLSTKNRGNETNYTNNKSDKEKETQNKLQLRYSSQ